MSDIDDGTRSSFDSKPTPRPMKTYQCPKCQSRVFFENQFCLACETQLGYLPLADVMLAVDAERGLACVEPNHPQADMSGRWSICANRAHIGCNWLAAQPDATASAAPYCDCCRYTRTVPPLGDPANHLAWQRLEQAKRYLFYSLHRLQLPIPDQAQRSQTQCQGQSPLLGLAFEFLAELPDQQKIFTGHDTGTITINVAEADDVKREQRRVSLHEPYRTLLGHLRHEIGHFYWELLIANSDSLEAFRQLFGDERQDYAAALKQHYAKTDDGSWQATHISRYASAHPWEDWAETWAHYLHINDAMDTAADWQVQMAPQITMQTAPMNTCIKPSAIYNHTDDAEFTNRLINEWLPLSQYLNAACRSLGEADAYPFILSQPVIDKLAFVHSVIRNASPATADIKAAVGHV
ncbi:MAG: putative zinc-binding metallopeptidase [Steroidobacteraceae bacterium]